MVASDRIVVMNAEPEGSEAGLRVTAPPPKVLAVNDPVWLEIDPAYAALIAS